MIPRFTYSRIFQIYSLVVLVKSGGTSTWSQWGSWTQCSRSCNGGTSYQTRKCVPTGSCGGGESVNYKVCNTQPCETKVADLRQELCGSYDAVTYKGYTYHWRPIIDPAAPCSLTCVAKENSLRRINLTPLILDGLTCRNMSDHVCLNGKCLLVGCDDVINSTTTLDECGVCGGDGSSCNQILAKYEWRTSGFGRCSVSCGKGVQHSRAVCIEKSTGDFVDANFCASFRPPSSLTKECTLAPCILTQWFTGVWSACSVSCGGGLSWRHVYCVEIGSDGVKRYSHSSYCKDKQPTSERKCNVGDCPIWYTGEWSPCAATCGNSLQYREVMCQHSELFSCDTNSKPDSVRKCSATAPCPKTTSSTKELVVEDRIQDTKPRFYTSAWSSCSTTCNIGIRSRYVECKVRFKFSDKVHVVDDTHCSDPKPHATEECFERFCKHSHMPDIVIEPPKDGHSNKDYYWRYANFTPCTKSCMRGRQDSMTECVRVVDIKVVNPTYCSGIPGLLTVSRVCNDIPCPPEWQFHRYSNCSRSCGGGVQEKLYRCIYYDTADYVPTVVPDHKCGKHPNRSTRTCNTHVCPPNWQIGKWSTCSTSCGKGTQVRKVLCVSRISDKKGEVVDRSRCRSSKPAIKKECFSKCVKTTPMIKQRRETFLQLAKGRKVVLRVGGKAVVIPKTTLIVRCPVKHFSRKMIYWLREQERVPMQGRVKALRNGALRIRNSRSSKDAGGYTCVASPNNASIVIGFHSSMEAARQAKYRLKYLSRTNLKGNINLADVTKLRNSSTIYKDMIDLYIKDSAGGTTKRSKIKRTIVTTPWSSCSRQCNGYGVQIRKASCERLTYKYTRILSMHVCKKRGLPIPHLKKICHSSSPCPVWFTNDWSKCEKSKCVRKNYAKQTRNVICQTQNRTVLKDTACDKKRRPNSTKLCHNPKCQPVWTASKWSKCMPECGETRNKYRRLQCVWRSDHTHARTACLSLPLPVAQHPCMPSSCDNHTNKQQCQDNSQNCHLVHRFRMCKNRSFYKLCCGTCSLDVR